MTRARLVRNLPRSYFADAQDNTLAESENLGRHEQSGAASRENAGESGSAFTFEAAAQQERSDKTNSSATNATPRDPSISDLPR